MIPVLTKQKLVHGAVVGLHCGKMRLSLSNVEATLVLANSIRVSLPLYLSIAVALQRCLLWGLCLSPL